MRAGEVGPLPAAAAAAAAARLLALTVASFRTKVMPCPGSTVLEQNQHFSRRTAAGGRTSGGALGGAQPAACPAAATGPGTPAAR